MSKKLTVDIFDDYEGDPNVFGIGAVFKRQAKREGWAKAEIAEVLTEVQNAEDYDAAIRVIMNHTEI